MNTQELKCCAAALMDWYTSHFRALPWRESLDPYRIWVSEIMLQQTRIEAVLPYYTRFMEVCPTVEVLAALPEERLMKLWEGLGYYSRARNLQKAARTIVAEYGGKLPSDYDKLLALSGIGDYTAGAIASIAFDIPVPAVDGNVMRVLSRLLNDNTDVLSSGAKRYFASIVRQMLPQQGAGRFNQALMELGETVCLPHSNPDCPGCPWLDKCLAYANHTVELLPRRAPKKPRRIEKRTVAVVVLVGEEPRILLHKRPSTGLLANLWELPNALTEEAILPVSITKHMQFAKDLHMAKHIFSHIEWHMNGKLYYMPHIALPDEYKAVTLRQLQNDYALPSAFRAYAAILPTLLQKEAN